jgi:sigma-B regulation protein RsbU (phosphoserine phosphatase)
LGGARPEQIMQIANQRLYTPQPRLFVALAYLLLQPGGRVTYALAGQPAPLVRCRRGGRLEVIEGPAPVHRLPLGALKEGAWDLRDLQLSPGDLLVLYSDGMTEAQNPAGEFFGEERLHATLVGNDGQPAAIVDGLMTELRAFVGDAEPYDDVTVVAVRWMGDA